MNKKVRSCDIDYSDWPKEGDLEIVQKERKQALKMAEDLAKWLNNIGDFHHLPMVDKIIESMKKG